MLEIISSAQAQEAAAAGGQSVLSGILPLILMLGVFYFLLIRPQQKKMREHRDMVSALRKGDKVVTSGGIFGVVAKVNEDSIQLDIADNTQVKLDKNSIAIVQTTKDTEKKAAPKKAASTAKKTKKK